MPTREDVLQAYLTLISAVNVEEAKFKVDVNGKECKLSFSAPIDVTMGAEILSTVAKRIEEAGDWHPDMFEEN